MRDLKNNLTTSGKGSTNIQSRRGKSFGYQVLGFGSGGENPLLQQHQVELKQQYVQIIKLTFSQDQELFVFLLQAIQEDQTLQITKLQPAVVAAVVQVAAEAAEDIENPFLVLLLGQLLPQQIQVVHYQFQFKVIQQQQAVVALRHPVPFYLEAKVSIQVFQQ